LANTSQPVPQSARPKLDVELSKKQVAVQLPVVNTNNVPIAVDHGWWQRTLNLLPKNQKADVRRSSVVSYPHATPVQRYRVLTRGCFLEVQLQSFAHRSAVVHSGPQSAHKSHSTFGTACYKADGRTMAVRQGLALLICSLGFAPQKRSNGFKYLSMDLDSNLGSHV
jgi:hypothetical protein